MWDSRAAVANRWSANHWWSMRSEWLVATALEPFYMYIKAEKSDRQRAIMEPKKRTFPELWLWRGPLRVMESTLHIDG